MKIDRVFLNNNWSACPFLASTSTHENITIFSKTAARQCVCFYLFIYSFFKIQKQEDPWQTPQLKFNFVNRTTWKDSKHMHRQTAIFHWCQKRTLWHQLLGASGQNHQSSIWQPMTSHHFEMLPWAHWIMGKRRVPKLGLEMERKEGADKLGTPWKIAVCLHDTVMFQKVPS